MKKLFHSLIVITLLTSCANNTPKNQTSESESTEISVAEKNKKITELIKPLDSVLDAEVKDKTLSIYATFKDKDEAQKLADNILILTQQQPEFVDIKNIIVYDTKHSIIGKAVK